MMNRELRTRLDLLRPSCESSVLGKQATQKSCHDRRAHAREFVVGDRVFARNLRPGPDWIPSTIIEVLGPVTYIVETDDGLRWKRHANQLKDWLSSSLTTPSSDPGSKEEQRMSSLSSRLLSHMTLTLFLLQFLDLQLKSQEVVSNLISLVIPSGIVTRRIDMSDWN